MHTFGWYNKYGNWAMNGGIMSADNREKLLDYVFTQQYVWKSMGQSDAKFVDASIQSQYESFKTKIDNQIANMQKQPSFVYSTINVDVGTSTVLTDTNNVLKDFVSFDKNIDGVRIQHNIGENTMTVSVDKNCTNENLKITEDKMKSWGIIKEETADNDTTVFFTFKEGVQNQLYSLHYNDPVSMPLNIKINMLGNLKISKTDVETNKPIDNTIFELLDSNNNIIATGTTDNKGIVEFNRIKAESYKIREKKSNDNYINNKMTYDIVINPSETTTRNITNEHKKGNLKIYKVDKDDNDLSIGAVEFDLIDYTGKIVKHLVTDVNGIAEIKNINTGNYTLRETLTKKEYNLAVDQNVVVNWNETMEYKIENEKKKGQIRIIKVDADHNEVRLEGVEFQIIDKNNHIIETIKTNSNGEAVTSRIPIGNYKIKEISLGTNEEYILNDDIKTINVEEDKICNIQFENEHKKGNLKIHKVDLDNNTIPVPDVEFEVIDKDGYKYTAISDENGIAYIENIRTGIATIRETKSNKIYKLNDETFEANIKWNETTEVTITNEKLKGQIEVYKVDSENNEIKLEGVEFEVINSNNEVVETIVTDKGGYAITSRIPIGEYKLKEVKTDNMHILNENIIKVDVTTDIVSRLDITNDRIKGQIKVIKTSEDDNFINGKVAGSPIENVKFKVYDVNNNLVDELTTSADGTAITKLLDKGSYYIKEVESGEWYLLNENTFIAEIKEHKEVVNIEIKNESEKPDVDIEKTGIIQTTASQEIKYEFAIKNTGNVPLSDFTWTDSLPTDYVRITKLITGTYNQDLNYSIYYKTNKNDYKLLKDNLNTKVNNYIDFSNLELEADEYVTEFKADFGTVDVGFESVVNPYIFVRVNSDVKNDDIFTNKTRIEGYNKTYMVWDEDDHTTNVYEKEVPVKKLPRTGC